MGEQQQSSHSLKRITDCVTEKKREKTQQGKRQNIEENRETDSQGKRRSEREKRGGERENDKQQLQSRREASHREAIVQQRRPYQRACTRTQNITLFVQYSLCYEKNLNHSSAD